MKMFDARKTGMIGLPYGGKTDDTLSRFHTIPACHGQTDGQTDGRTDRITISISRVSSSMLTRDRNATSQAVIADRGAVDSAHFPSAYQSSSS